MKNLQIIRKQKEISQLKLANMLGVSRSTIAMWESGASQPDHETLIKLAKIFEVSTDFLLGVSSLDIAMDNDEISEQEKKLFELYQKAKKSDDPRDNAVADAVEKLLGMDE